MTVGRDTVPVTTWRVRARTGSPVDVIELELATGESALLKMNRAEGSLLLRASHPAMRWRVLAWEPHWSASVKVEIRPTGDGRAAARVVDPGDEVTAIYRVPLVIALAMARHGRRPVGLHRSMVGRCLDADSDPADTDEILGFQAFLAPPAPEVVVEHNEPTMSMQ